MKLFITEKQKEILIEALRTYRDEQFTIADSVKSNYLRESFKKDAESTGDLITAVQNTREDYRLLDEGIRAILNRPEDDTFSNFIPAIRYCRQETGWFLKDAKEYVEKIRDSQ